MEISLTAVFYWLLVPTLFIILMRLRKIAITPKTGPRKHRSTYKK